MTLPTVLLVDDEPKVLSALTRQLLEEDFCEVKAALSGAEGLENLQQDIEFALIISDYHMPGMDGISFLVEAQKLRPDAVRIMLTGAAGLEMAVDSVNRGHIFRFLLKPCPPETFIPAVKAGLRQYQLVTGERELLNKTLNGAVKIMIDLLSALNPEAFAQAARLRELARALAAALQVENLWEVELAALLCRVGSVTVPPEVLEKWNQTLPLNERERSMIEAVPRISQQLVQNIPRLENVAQAIGLQQTPFVHGAQERPSGKAIPMAARILKLVLDYDRALARSGTPPLAVAELLRNASQYDPDLLALFQRRVLGVESVETPQRPAPAVAPKEVKMPIEDVIPGMMLVRDVYDKRGRLVVAKGTIITDVLKQRLVNYFWSQAIVEPVVVGEEKFL
ncbi:MAG: response regulator [Anaerolineae bacterium]|nr:response regulator [Anaerolineae bacterium]